MENDFPSTERKIAKSLVPKPTRMPFMNFVQAFRSTNQGFRKSLKYIVKLAAKTWGKLSEEEKQPFVELAQEQKLRPRLRPARRRVKLLARTPPTTVKRLAKRGKSSF